ncbi:DUF2948 family protein [Jannaschia sp. Os4]|uniref:DUF2948 family protein n=1 Tax=Jannaschia sp. Os4 TaxID=2807617 RepID=UPI00193ADB13|nr:DUF2948 family protein [Jannaschia sp. Os4]MBM2576768.1 DUF2948 family protein [Jannaschia sp. Os4]
MADARFGDADGRALRLLATDAEDLQVVSALVQDAVLTGGDMRWLAADRQLALLVNRVRREAGAGAQRVRAVMIASGVTKVRGQGVVPGDGDIVLSLLSLDWTPGGDPEDPAGTLRLTFAGDGVVVAEAECLDLRLHDVTAPYAAPSGKVPSHDDD